VRPQARDAQVDQPRIVRCRVLRAALPPFVRVLHFVPRGKRALLPFADQRKPIGSRGARYALGARAISEAEVQAVREVGSAMAAQMAEVRAALDTADIDPSALEPHESLLDDLQAVYLKHDQAVEALTSATAAVEGILHKGKNLSKQLGELKAAVILATEANVDTATIKTAQILLTNARANVRVAMK
jgi:hypothetical protein